MRRDSFERFYYEKVALEGCGCAEYVSTRLRDLDGLAVKAEARGIAWTATGASARLGTAGGSDKEGSREGKLAVTAPFHGSSMVSGSGASLWLSSSGLGAGSSRTSRTGRLGWSNSSGFRFRDLSCFSLCAIVTSSMRVPCPS